MDKVGRDSRKFDKEISLVAALNACYECVDAHISNNVEAEHHHQLEAIREYMYFFTMIKVFNRSVHPPPRLKVPSGVGAKT